MKLNQRLLDRAAKHATKGLEIQRLLSAAFEERYGTTYSDVDADFIIDVLDYGTGDYISLSECDREMTNAGFPPRKNRDADRSD